MANPLMDEEGDAKKGKLPVGKGGRKRAKAIDDAVDAALGDNPAREPKEDKESRRKKTIEDAIGEGIAKGSKAKREY